MHLNFGSNSEPVTSVVRADYTAKPVPHYKQFIPEGVYDVHLAVSDCTIDWKYCSESCINTYASISYDVFLTRTWPQGT